MALEDFFNTSNTDITAAPSYLVSADNHNLGNVGESWWDVNPANLPKFAAVSVISGVNSIYNTGVMVGNFLGGDFKESDTNNLISGLDSNLGAYYAENQKAADLMGFLVTSLIPGTAGIKILNAGQKALAVAREGMVGTNLGLGLGLRTPAIEGYVAAASKEIATGQAAFSSITSNTTKALSLGVYQNVLEGAAFETAVQATMQASPVLQDQSKSDVLWNIATGGLFGGVLGGAVTGTKNIFAIRKGVRDISAELTPVSSRATFLETPVKSDKLVALADDLEHGPILDPGDPLYTEKVALLEQRQNRIRLDMRSTIHSMVPGGDSDIGRMVTDFTEHQGATDIMSHFLDADQIARVGTKTDVEDLIKEGVKSGTPTDHLQLSYWKLQGEGAGTVLDSTPKVLNLADTLPQTAAKETREAILQDVRGQRFKLSDQWDASATPLNKSGHLDAERRYIWATELMDPLKKEAQVGMYDLPILERALQDSELSIRILDKKGNVIKDGFGSRKELQDYVIAAKDDVASKLQVSALKGKSQTVNNAGGLTDEVQTWVNEKIGKITNTKVSRLEGTSVQGDGDYFAYQSAQADRTKYLAGKDIKPVKGEEQDVRFLPTYAKVSRVVRDKEVDGHVVDGFTFIKAQQKVLQEQVNNVIAKQAPQISAMLPEFGDSYLAKTDALGTGAGALKINNPDYNSPGSLVSFIGSLLSKFSRDSKDAFASASSGVLRKVAQSQDATIEWSSLNQRISRSGKTWVKYTEYPATEEEAAQHYLVEATEYGRIFGKDGSRDLTDLEDAENLISIKNDSVGELAQAHAEQSRNINSRRNERASTAGADQAKRVEVEGAPIFRAIPPDPKNYPFIAFVKDPTITSQGHTSMIFAESEGKLRELVASAQRTRPELDVYYKHDTEEFFKARQAYEYDRTLSDNYIDSSLKNQGIYSNYFASTDPKKIADEFIAHHNKLIDIDAREVISAKYQPQINWLQDQAQNYSRVNTSRFGGNFDKLEAEGKNPYLSYVKTMLNLSRVNEVPLWRDINKLADDTVSKLVGKVQDIWGTNTGTKTPEQLEEINKSLKAYGMNMGYYDAATDLLVNHSAPKAVLSKFIGGANAVLSKLVLALDPLNSLVNVLGANILRTTELTQQIDNAVKGDVEASSALSKLYKLDVTGQGKGDLIRSPAKLMATAAKDFFDTSGKASGLQELYKNLGLQRDFADQFRSILGDDFALKGTETAGVLESKLKNAIQKANALGESAVKYTGNKLAEEFNRFVSARSAQLLTQPAVDKGLMSLQEQYSYMNTFVNRVEGNIIASQRPFAFQGPVGQAIGLFQSYQFNMMQQMFRYIGEGSAKDAAMLLGLQGTFFGVQGLPAFQAINQHIIGTASGNKNHTDLYDATYGIAGKNLGDLLTYGLPSKLLQTNLYSRGDINPRQLTVIPTALSEVPIVGAFTKFFGSLKDTATKIAGGSNVWETLLQGIEHNGISRPLSGIAQTLQATTGKGVPFSTTSQGSIMFSNDVFSLATISRLAGGRPLDEAIINDGIFRIHSYQQDSLEKMNRLGQEIKNSSIQGQTVDGDQVGKFLDQYVAAGGKQVMFNKYMTREIMSANKSGSDTVLKQLNSPFAQKLQLLMGSPLQSEE